MMMMAMKIQYNSRMRRKSIERQKFVLSMHLFSLFLHFLLLFGLLLKFVEKYRSAIAYLAWIWFPFMNAFNLSTNSSIYFSAMKLLIFDKYTHTSLFTKYMKQMVNDCKVNAYYQWISSFNYTTYVVNTLHLGSIGYLTIKGDTIVYKQTPKHRCQYTMVGQLIQWCHA